MMQLKLENVHITERGIDVVARDDSGVLIRLVHIKVDAEWLLSDQFARTLDRAARRVRAREAEVDPACCDTAMF